MDEPDLNKLCICCMHEYGTHTDYTRGPCTVYGCGCPSFKQLEYVYPQPATAEEMYAYLRSED